MKKILIVFSLCGLLLSGCENFLDTENLTQKNTANFPTTEAEMNDLLSGVYTAAMMMEKHTSANCLWMINEIMSDERFAGGGINDIAWANVEKLAIVDPNFLLGAWQQAYRTIYRANITISQLDAVQWGEDLTARNNIEGQARFFRAYAFFYLARMFGTAPMPLNPEPVNIPRSPADDLFAQIGLDFTKAIELMPSTERYGGQDANRSRATKWAAEAFLARAWLFYTGYYEKDSMPMAAEGEEAAGSISSADIAAHLQDCIDNSGHDLIEDYRELWPYTNTASNNEDNGELIYPYAVNNELEWIGEDGANIETVFAFSSSPTNANWNDDVAYSNPIATYCSPRQHASGDAKNYYPFGYGWGFGPVNPNLWNDWSDEDVRKRASIINVSEELEGYLWGADSQQHETGYLQKKYIRLVAPNADGDLVNYGTVLWGTFVSTDMQLGNVQDLVTMRFADVLLMHSEVTGTANGMNRVRDRADLDPVDYSLAALKAERQYELAFEGVRYYDLLRWGDAATELPKQDGVAVRTADEPATMSLPNLATRLNETGGFMPIPRQEIDLSDGVLEQTPGWTL